MHNVKSGIIVFAIGCALFAVSMGFGGDGVTGDPLPLLTAEERAVFLDGRDAFMEVEGPDEGLGPFFNAASCGECHAHPTTGGVAPPNRPELRELRIGRYLADGTFDALLDRGGPVLHRRGLGDLDPAQVAGLPRACRDVRGTTTAPPEAQVTSIRVTTPVFGLGLVEAIPAEEILKRVGAVPGVSGRAQIVGTDVGRFGWKAQHASLMAFAGEAYLIEMGITNPLAPREAHALRTDARGAAARDCDPRPELEDEGNDLLRFTNFMRFLAPPSRGPITAQVVQGEGLFKRAGCDGCHVPALQTGRNAIAALDRKPVPAYSDFLLHDVGTGDGVPQGYASGSEFRTAPLWGLRFRPFLLHDGRTGDVLEAVRAHRGDAQAAADVVFQRFDAGDRAALAAFLKSL